MIALHFSILVSGVVLSFYQLHEHLRHIRMFTM